MSELTDAIDKINASASATTRTTTFFDDVGTADDNTIVTNPNNGKQTPSIKKQVKDQVTPELQKWEGEHNAQMDKFDQEFYEQAQYKPAIPWAATTPVSDKFQLYSESTNRYRPNPSKMPFTTGATIADDIANDLWITYAEATLDQVNTIANAGDSQLAGGKILPVENRSAVSGEDLTGASFVKLSGGDFSTLTQFPIVKKIPSASGISGALSNINLTVRPYSATIGSDEVWLLDISHYKVLDKFSVKAFWAKGDKSIQDSTQINAAIATGNLYGVGVRAPAGSYLLGETIDIRNLVVDFTGEGTGKFTEGSGLSGNATIFIPVAGLTRMLSAGNADTNAGHTTQVNVGGFVLDGENQVDVTGLYVRQVHWANFKDIFSYRTKYGFLTSSDWGCNYDNCRAHTADTGWWLQGENNTVALYNCGAVNTKNYGVRITHDYGVSFGLVLRDSDIEFNGGIGVSVDAGNTTVTMDSVYLEANYLGGLEAKSGFVNVNNGNMIYHFPSPHEATSHGYILSGGYISVKGTMLSAQVAGDNLDRLIKGGPGNISFEDVFIVTNTPSYWEGDVLATKNIRTNISERYGRDFKYAASLGGQGVTSNTKVYFSSGSVEPSRNDLLTASLGATAVVVKVITTSGGWSTGNAAGYMYVRNVTGNFSKNDTINNTTTGTINVVNCEGRQVDCKEMCIVQDAAGGIIALYCDLLKSYDPESTLQLVITYQTGKSGLFIPRVCETQYGNTSEAISWTALGNPNVTGEDGKLRTFVQLRKANDSTRANSIQYPYFHVAAFNMVEGDYLILHAVSLTDQTNIDSTIIMRDICKF